MSGKLKRKLFTLAMILDEIAKGSPVIDLCGNNCTLSARELLQVMDVLCHSHSSRGLRLSLLGRIIHECDMEKAANILKCNTALLDLDLRCSGALPPYPFPPLFHALQINSTLTKLDLSNSQIDGVGVAQLGKALETNVGLVSLSIRYCTIEDSAFLPIGHALKINQTLSSLDATGNLLSDFTILALSDALKTNKKLSCLRLSRNRIKDSAVVPLTAAFKINTTLTVFTLDQGNFISYSSITSLNKLVQNNRALFFQVLDAVRTGNTDSLTSLMARGANVAAQDDFDWRSKESYTPLMIAARYNQSACAKLLLDQSFLCLRAKVVENTATSASSSMHGADNPLIDKGRTALGIAEKRRHYEVAGLIFAHMRKSWPWLRERTVKNAFLLEQIQSKLPISSLSLLVLDYVIEQARTIWLSRIPLGQVYLKHLNLSEPTRADSLLPAASTPTPMLPSPSFVATPPDNHPVSAIRAPGS